MPVLQSVFRPLRVLKTPSSVAAGSAALWNADAGPQPATAVRTRVVIITRGKALLEHVLPIAHLL
jgi:hypothetical protein